jgi:hypothetical protein
MTPSSPAFSPPRMAGFLRCSLAGRPSPGSGYTTLKFNISFARGISETSGVVRNAFYLPGRM